MVLFASRSRLVAAVASAALALAGAAQAQTMNANSASYNAGYGRTPGQENQPVNIQMRDANGNLAIVDGIIEAGADASVFASGGATAGVGDVVSGAGTSSNASAIANNLVVVTQGNNNTVIVDSVQTNSGNVTASSSVSGGNHGH
jgi:holdfast attachment protein HfaA